MMWILPKAFLPGDVLRCSHYNAIYEEDGERHEFICPLLLRPSAWKIVLTIVQCTRKPNGDFDVMTAELGQAIIDKYATEYEVLNR